MAQTLKAITALSTPVVHSDFTNKFLDQNLSALNNLAVKQLKAVIVISLVYELNAYGGTNYISPMNIKQLHQDAAVLFGGYTILDEEESIQKVKVEAALAWNAAVAKGATVTTDVNTLIAVAPGLLEVPEQPLNLMILLLRYKLAVIGA